MRAPGDAFGRTVEHYERGRPHWPDDAVDHAVRELELTSDAVVLDLAAGSGRLTQRLLQRFSNVIAVEPDDRMRARLEGVEALSGHAESIPLSDHSVDAVFVGEAFHWFDVPRALGEIARVLRPRGGLALLWIVPLHDVPDEAGAFWDQATRRGGVPGGPRYRSGVWREPFAVAPFDELQEAHFEGEETVTREMVVSYVLSISSIACLPDGEREQIGRRLRALLPAPTYVRRLRTDVFWTRRAA
jgi:SAM-dependent methyltransferase